MGAPPTAASFNKKDLIHYAIAIVIGILIYTLGQPGTELTEYGIRILAITVPTLYLWLTTSDLLWTSLLFLAATVMTRILPPNAVWEATLGHFSVILVTVFVMLDGSLNETGAIKKVANWFITRKFVQGRPYAFMAMFFGANLVVGLFMQNLALAVMYLALTLKLCENLGLKKSDSLFKVLLLGTLWGNGVLSLASPIAKFFPNWIIGWVQSNLGFTISYAQWFAVGIPFTVLMFLLLMLVVRICNPDTSALMKFNVEEYKKENDPPLGKRGKIALIGFVCLLAVILLPDLIIILGAQGGLYTVMRYIIGLSATVPAMILICVLCLIRAEGKPVMDLKAAVGNVSLAFIIFMSAAVFLGTMLGFGDGGIGPWLGTIIAPVVDNMSPFMIVVVMMTLAIILSQFASNIVVVVLFLTIGAPLFMDGGGIGPVAFAILVGFISGMSCATPPSVITAALYYGPGHIVAKDVLKQNLIFLVFALIGVIAITPVVVGIIGA